MPKIKLTIKGDELKKKLNLQDGHTPTRDEILAVIKPYLPKDGKTPTTEELVELIKPLIPDISLIIDESVRQAKNEALDALKPLIPTYEQFEQKLPTDGQFYRDALELLSGEDRLSAEAIKGLPEIQNDIKEFKVNAPGRGIFTYVGGSKKGLLNTIDFIGPTYSKVNGRDTLTFGEEVENSWDRLGTVISPHNAGDSIGGISAAQFLTTATPLTNAPGLMQWNATDGTMDIGLDYGVTMQVGQELPIKCYNNTGSTIPNGTPVYISGRQGHTPEVSPARSDVEATSRILGITTTEIEDKKYGYTTTFGYVRQLKTNYSGAGDWGTTWAINDKLYVSKTVAGQLTNVEPDAPHHSDVVGLVAIVGAIGIGAIGVNITRHFTLQELADVDGTALTADGQFPSWHNTEGYFDFDKNINDYVRTDRLDDTTSGSAGCSLVGIPAIGTPTYKTQCDFNASFGSAGRKTGGEITDATGGYIAVAAGTGFIKATDDDNAELLSFNFPAPDNIQIPSGTTRYIGVEYNAGTPRVVARTSFNWNKDTEFSLGRVINETINGTDGLHIISNPWWVTDGITNVIERLRAEGRLFRDANEGGLMLSVTGTRNIAVTAGTIWSNLNKFAIPGIDTNVSGTVEYYWYSSTNGWQDGDVTAYSATQYNDPTQATLQTLGVNKYYNTWVYAEADDKKIALVYGQGEYATQAAAAAVQAPALLPVHIQQNALLIGRIIAKQGTTAPILVQSAFTTTLGTSTATNHNALAGLQGGAAGDYLHLTTAEYNKSQIDYLKLDQTTSQTMTGLSDGYLKLTSGVIGTGAIDLSGYVPTTRTLTINGTALDLSADRSWTVSDANLSITDVTTNNSSSSKHGFLPKLENSGTKYLRDDGTWQTVSGGGTPGGSDTQIQFNDGGAFGGDADFTWNKTTNTLKILGGLLDNDRYTTADTSGASLQSIKNRILVNATTTTDQLVTGVYNEIKDTSTRNVTNWSGYTRHEGLYNYVNNEEVISGTCYDAETNNAGLLNIVRKAGTQTARVTDYWFLDEVGIKNIITDYTVYKPSSAGEGLFAQVAGIDNQIQGVGAELDTDTVTRSLYGIKNSVSPALYYKAANMYGMSNYLTPTSYTTNTYLYYGNIASALGTKQYGLYINGVGTSIMNVVKGNTKFGNTVGDPTAQIHLSAGSATAGTAPIKFTSGTLTTAAVAGQMEFLTDDYYLTIGTGAARQKIVMTAGLTSGKYPIATTNGRLTDGVTPLSGTKVYYVSDTSGGSVTRKLTFTNGILTSET